MPAERVAMRQAREIIRLKFSACVPAREIARRFGVAASTVRETPKRFESVGLVWPLPADMTDGALEGALYANRRSKWGHRLHCEPDWPTIHRELKRKHVTLLIVWDEYIAENPGGYSYSRFCELYRAFESKLSPTMRQTHAAGEHPAWGSIVKLVLVRPQGPTPLPGSHLSGNQQRADYSRRQHTETGHKPSDLT